MRELVVLGTSAQAPTRRRNHNGYLLRWDGDGLLFDPGEGTQRQMILAGVSASAITRICITHFHGDHCLGLPGVLQRMSLDRVAHPVDLHFPAAGRPYVDRLRQAAVFHETAEVRVRPAESGDTVDTGGWTLTAATLDHGTPTLGWRLSEPPGRRMLPDRLAAAGVRGPDIGRLQREGSLLAAGRRVRLEDVSEPRPGQHFAFVMDTRYCEAAVALAAGADLVVCESTFLSRDADLAREYGHMTAADAARIAAEARARRLVLTHFSQRYTDEREFLDEAGAVFGDVVMARDLDRVPVPARRGGPAAHG